MITEKDEGRHPAGPGELWNESYYFNFYDSQTGIGGFTRIGLQENLKKSNALCLVFKKGRPAYNRILFDQPYTASDMDQGLTVGGLTYRTLEPLRNIKIDFQGRDTNLDLTWKALHPVVNLGANQEKMLENLASAHLEQGGEVTGSVTLRGVKAPIQGYGFRDHAWGIRDWEAIEGYQLTWPIFDKDLLFSCVQVTLPDGHTSSAGFLFDGSDNLQITEQHIQIEFDRDGLTQKSVAVQLTDEKGRQWKITGNRIAKYTIPWDGFLISETMFEYRLPQGKVGYGLCECGFRL